jgi:malate dehydrogenase (quinone)
MLSVLEKVFAKKVATPEWQAKIRRIIPSYGTKLNEDPQKAFESLAMTSETLQLTPPPRVEAAVPTPVEAPADDVVVKPVPDMAP